MKKIKFILFSVVSVSFAFLVFAQEGATGLLSDLMRVNKGRTKAVTSSVLISTATMTGGPISNREKQWFWPTSTDPP